MCPAPSRLHRRADVPDPLLFTVLDNLSLPTKFRMMPSPSEWRRRRAGLRRGLEYDTMSRTTPSSSSTKSFHCRSPRHVKLSHDPDAALPWEVARASCASSWLGIARTSTTASSAIGYFVNQQWPWNLRPAGAWGFHQSLIPKSPANPSLWLEVGDGDLYNPNVMRDGNARLGRRQRRHGACPR